MTAFFTMIALDKKGRPTKVPELTLETEEEKRAFEEGRLRYERHKHKKINRPAKIAGSALVTTTAEPAIFYSVYI